MNRPVIEFLDPETLDFINGTADYTSLSWENCTDSCGMFEIHIPRAMPELSHGIIAHICRDIPEPYGIVTCIKLSDRETVVIGNMLSKVLDWRYLQNDGPDLTLSTSGGIGRLICLCAQYGCINNSDDFFNKTIAFEYPDEVLSVKLEADMKSSCLELMTSLARDANYCFGCTIVNGQLKVFAYPYTDKGQVIYSTDCAADGPIYTSSCDSERNVFGYSLGDSQNGYVYRTSSKQQFSGTKRRMLNLGRFENIPTGIIREKTALLTPSESIEAVLRLQYPNEFSLGDIITFKHQDWGLIKKISVSAVREVWEDKYSCSVTFGIPQQSVYRKLLRIYR